MVSFITMQPSVIACLTNIVISRLADITVEERRFGGLSAVVLLKESFLNELTSMLSGFESSVWEDSELLVEGNSSRSLQAAGLSFGSSARHASMISL
jgi:hypothetical protein